MDILDIDSLLNEDSFCLMEDKIYDDVTNIIKQWKINNVQNVMFDSRTFTRTKQKIATNLEPQFKSYMNNFSNNEKIKIGGLVTKSQQQYLLGDTSPPNSKYSLQDMTTNTMLNSLITSTDFSNIAFLYEEHISTAPVNSKIVFPEILNDFALIKDDTEEISDTLSNPNEFFNQEDLICNSAFHARKSYEKLVENNEIILVDSILAPNIKVSDDPQHTMFLNDTFNVECFTNSPKFRDLRKLNRKISDFQNDLHKGSSKKSCLETPYNSIPQKNILAQSTPQNANESALIIHLSPITSVMQNNMKHTDYNAKSEKISLLKNTYENKLNFFLNDCETTKNDFLIMESTNKLFHEQWKSNGSANIKQSVDESKNPFSGKIGIEVAHNNIAFKENSIFFPTTERLLNKRDRIYDNLFTEPENIFCIESKINEQNNSVITTKFDKEISYEMKLSPAISKIQNTSNNGDRYKTMKIIQKTNLKVLNSVDDNLLKKECNSRFTIKNLKTANHVTENDTISVNKICEHISSTYICKANSASELKNDVCPKESAPLKYPDMKNNMGLKAKSFHNLYSNNFGYSRNLSSVTVSSKLEYPDRGSSDDKICDKLTEVLYVRPATSRGFGLIRPSTGIYSKAVPKNKDGFGYKSKKYEFEKNPDTNQTNNKSSLADINGSTKDTIRYINVISSKARFPETRVRVNIKESRLMRPTSFQKKQ